MKVYVVNENDEIIGVKDREQLADDDISRVTGLRIENFKGEVLMAQRKFTKKYSPGKWGPAASGTVEEGESYEDNIIKEAEEELGLKDFPMEGGTKFRVNMGHEYFAQWFTAKLDKDISEFKIQEDEVEQIKWIDKKELLADFKKNPDSYIASAKVWMEEFCK